MRTPQINSALRLTISDQRLTKYLEESDHDLDRSIDLYENNMRLSEAFYLPLQHLEVCLRNKLNECISDHYGCDWLVQQTQIPLNDFSRRMINQAKESATENPSHGDVVAELKFAFWVGLISRGYDQTLWRSCLHSCFQNMDNKRRSIVHGRLNAIRRFRNRVAHHEPIFHLDCGLRYTELQEAISWMCEDTSNWSNHHSRVTEILNAL